MTNIKRNTVQRQITLNILRKLNHPTVNEISAEVQKEHPSISKTTLYRNLRQLHEDGIIRRLPLAGEAERYDRNPEPHYHFICRVCGAIHDTEIDMPFDLDTLAESKYPFTVEWHDIIFAGLCAGCTVLQAPE